MSACTLDFHKQIDGEESVEQEMIKVTEVLDVTSWLLGELFNIQQTLAAFQAELRRRHEQCLQASNEDHLTLPPPSYKGPILLRAFHAASFCKYNLSLGILSSNFTACKLAIFLAN